MNFWQKISRIFVIVLIMISAAVAAMLICGVSPWIAIVVYWVVLTCKNVCDYLGLKKR